MYAIAEAPAQSEVAGVGLGDAQVVKKDSGFNALLRKQRRCSEEKKSEEEESRFLHSTKHSGRYDEWRTRRVVNVLVKMREAKDPRPNSFLDGVLSRILRVS
jgi:hypothetical protein